jgi:hypothetical protein
MYPYDYTKDDNGLSLALIAPLFVAVYSAKHLSSGVRNFLWKNYWWICALVFIWIGSNYSENFIPLILFGAVGAFGGLIGASGFDPKDFNEAPPPQDNNSQQSTEQVSELPPIKTSEKSTHLRSPYSPTVANQLPKVTTTPQSVTHHSDSAQAIIDSQRKIYDQGIWIKKAHNISNEKPEKVIPSEIETNGWKYDKSKGILWNESTKEVLLVSSGLGFSLTNEHFILYNKVVPRKILRTEVIEEVFNFNKTK